MTFKIFMLIILLILIFIIIINHIKYRRIRKEMKDLTGNYIHNKTPEGLVIKVQYKVGNLLKYRIATEEEIIILKKHGFL